MQSQKAVRKETLIGKKQNEEREHVCGTRQDHTLSHLVKLKNRVSI